MSKLKNFFKNCPEPTTPISKEGSELFATLLFNKNDKGPMGLEEFKSSMIGKGKTFTTIEDVPSPVMGVFLFLDGTKSGILIDIESAIFISTISHSLRDVFIYTGYCANKVLDKNLNEITIGFIAEHVFMFGSFSEEQLVDMWEEQKDEGEDTLSDDDEWSELIFGEDLDKKVRVNIFDKEHEVMTIEQVTAFGGVKDPQEIGDRVFFWMNKRYVNTSKSDFDKIGYSDPV